MRVNKEPEMMWPF